MKITHYYIIALLSLLTALFSCIPETMQAQTRKVMNRPYIDTRRFHYGFFAGVHLQDIELQQNGYIDPNGNQWFAEVPDYEPGFSVGILGEFYINKNIAFRAIPSMHFGTKKIAFRNEANQERQYQNIKSTYFSVPLDFKFAGERFNNFRPYLVTGVNPMLDLTVKKQKQYLLTNTDVYLEIGMGCDFYLPFFKFIPEIKFLYGLTNVVNKNRHDISDESQMIFTKSVDKGKSKMIVFTFYFE